MAIKNLFLTTFKYESESANTILEPSVDANDMRLKLHEERISNTENALAKIDVVADTVAREVSDLKLAKAASAFYREERNLRLNPQDRDAWGKKSEEEKMKTIEDLVKQLLDGERLSRSQIRLVKENPRGPAWIKLTLPASEDKFIFEVALRDLREKEARAKKSNEKRNWYTSVRLPSASGRKRRP